MALEKFNFAHNQSEVTDHTRFNVLTTQFESGKKQKRYKGPLPRRWELNFEKTNLGNNEAKQIREFFEARNGSFEPFLWDWKKEDGTVEEITVRFTIDDFQRAINYNTKYSFTLPIEEVL